MQKKKSASLYLYLLKSFKIPSTYIYINYLYHHNFLYLLLFFYIKFYINIKNILNPISICSTFYFSLHFLNFYIFTILRGWQFISLYIFLSKNLYYFPKMNMTLYLILKKEYFIIFLFYNTTILFYFFKNHQFCKKKSPRHCICTF